MNYIKQLNAFFESILLNPLNPNTQCLYNVLLHINNKCNWEKEFTVANSTLMAFTGMNISALQRARNNLIQNGYIKYKKGKNNNAGCYTIMSFEQQNEHKSDIEATQKRHGSDSTTNTLNKLNKTKLNVSLESKDSCPNSQNLDDIVSKKNSNRHSKREILSLDKENFDLIWKEYPRKDGKTIAFQKYRLYVSQGREINGEKIKLTPEQIYNAVSRYAEKVKGYDKKYIQMGSTFFNNTILDYVDFEEEKEESEDKQNE